MNENLGHRLDKLTAQIKEIDGSITWIALFLFIITITQILSCVVCK